MKIVHGEGGLVMMVVGIGYMILCYTDVWTALKGMML
jgi:hypothetical protein